MDMLDSAITKNHRARMWHTRGVDSMIHLRTVDILDPNKTSDLIPKVTHLRTGQEETFSIQHFLFSLAPQDAGPGKEHLTLILSCQPTYSGGEHITTTSRRHAAKAEMIVQSLGMYMIKQYGVDEAAIDAIQTLLSDTGVEQYHATGWDEENKQAIALEEKEQNKDLHVMEFEWAPWMDDEKPAQQTLYQPTAHSPRRQRRFSTTKWSKRQHRNCHSRPSLWMWTWKAARLHHCLWKSRKRKKKRRRN
jgi:hypothetical protein